MQIRSGIPLFLLTLILIIPQTIYIIGEKLGHGMAWPFWRYQETYFGISIISIIRDLEILLSGKITGKTTISLLVWFTGAAILAAAILLAAYDILNEETHNQVIGILVCGFGILFLISSSVQYGLLFSGPAGIVIPIGFPLTIVAGWWIWSRGDEEPVGEPGS